MSLGVQGVMARISELNAQLGLTPAAPASSTGPDGTSGTKFASALAGAAGGPSTGVTGDQVVDSAKKYLGTPYVFGSTDPDRGLDCSALVQRAYKDLGVDLPRNSWQQAKAG